MLRKFAVALVAASLIAGPVFAQTNATGNAPVTAGQPAKAAGNTTAATPTVKKNVAHRRVVHKHVAKKHVAKHLAKHHAKKTHVSKAKHVTHGKAAKRIKKPVEKTLG